MLDEGTEQEREECLCNLKQSQITRDALDCDRCPVYDRCSVIQHWIECQRRD